MKLRLWRGHHSKELASNIQWAWDNQELLILCPAALRDFRFISGFPWDSIEFLGDWPEDVRTLIRSLPASTSSPLQEIPVLGVFTSGTLSATPKLVLYSKRCIEASLNSIYSLFDTSQIEHLFCYPQAFHTFGLTLGYVASHINGWKLHTPEGKYSNHSHAQRIAIRESRLLTLGTPTHFYDLMQSLKKSGKSIGPSSSCIVGGSSVSLAMWSRIQNELKIQAPSIGYGCTEASPGITHLRPGTAPLVDHAIGVPLPSIRAERIAGRGLEISGASLCVGIVEEGILKVPESLLIRDQIEIAPDGSWVFGGRLDLTLNRGGAKYSLEFIEKTIWEKLGMVTVATTVIDARLGEDLGLVIQNSSLSGSSLLAIQELLKNDFALQLQSKNSRFLDAFPLNECSKLDRRAIRAMFSKDFSPHTKQFYGLEL